MVKRFVLPSVAILAAWTLIDALAHRVLLQPQRVLVAKTLLFLGSSTAAKSQAKAVAARLATEDVAFLPWWEAFTPGRTLLEELDAIRGKVSGALLLFSPEAEATVRGRSVQTPNLNVLFEFGYFYGHFKKERVAMLKYGDFYLPSDFGGYIHVFGSTYFKRGAVVAVGKRTRSEYARWLESAGFPASVEKVPAPPAKKLAPIKYPQSRHRLAP